MSVSLQSLVDLPAERPKRSRLRRVATFALVALVVVAAAAVLLTAAGIKFVMGRF